jgi:hypothetical protein
LVKSPFSWLNHHFGWLSHHFARLNPPSSFAKAMQKWRQQNRVERFRQNAPGPIGPEAAQDAAQEPGSFWGAGGGFKQQTNGDFMGLPSGNLT